MFRRAIVGFVVLSASSLVIAEESCNDVVADTVAEMRVGVGDNWNDEIERLARAAAGAACVKAMSGRYNASVTEEVVGNQATAASSTASSDSAQTNEDAAKDDDSWSFGGLTFKSMSGSPGKKPYERQRQQPKEDTEAEQ